MDIFNLRITRKPKETESKVLPKPSYMGLPMEQADSGDLTKADLGATFIKEPLIQKGIWKKNKDLFGGGWHVVHRDSKQKIDENDKKLLDDFDKEAQTKLILILAGVSSDVYGDGFIEKLYEEKLALTEEAKRHASEQEPVGRLAGLKILDGEFISKYEPKPYTTPDSQRYYVLRQGGSVQDQFFHPARLEHITERKYPGKLFGISRIYIGRNIIDSKIKADKYYGSFIEWAGMSMLDVTYTGASPNDIKYLSEHIYTKRKLVNIHDEKQVLKTESPTVFNPEPFNNYFYINIAALVDMPWYILAGVSPGQLTGSEIGVADYYKTLMNLQETVYTPILESIYTELLEGNGSSFDNYRVEWNPIYVDENSEADILTKNTNSAVAAVGANMITEEEGRLMMRNGIMDKDGNCVLADEMPDIEPPPVIQPVLPPQGEPVEKPPVKPNEEWLTAEQKLIVEQEKLLGRLELIEQEKRIEDASKKQPKKKR
jgi:hypothetical protein